MAKANPCPICGGEPKQRLYGIPMLQFKDADARWYYAESAFHGSLFVDEMEKWGQDKDIDSRRMFTATSIECSNCGAMTLPSIGFERDIDIWNKGHVIMRFGPTDEVRILSVPDRWRKLMEQIDEKEKDDVSG